MSKRLQGWHEHLRPDLDKHATAKELGVSYQTISYWWDGTHRPTHEHLEEYVSKVLRMSMAEFWSAVPAKARAS